MYRGSGSSTESTMLDPSPPGTVLGFVPPAQKYLFPVSHIQVGGRLNMSLAARLAEVSSAHRTQKQGGRFGSFLSPGSQTFFHLWCHCAAFLKVRSTLSQTLYPDFPYQIRGCTTIFLQYSRTWILLLFSLKPSLLCLYSLPSPYSIILTNQLAYMDCMSQTINDIMD